MSNLTCGVTIGCEVTLRITRDQLLTVTRLRYDAKLMPDERREKLQASIDAGLIDGPTLEATALYYSLVGDDVERLSRTFTRGWTHIADARRKIAANDRALLGLDPVHAEAEEQRGRGGIRKNAGRTKIHVDDNARKRAWKRGSVRRRNQTIFANESE